MFGVTSRLRALFPLLRERSGNVGVMMALGAATLMGAVGVGLDFKRALNDRAALQSAADSAALAAAYAHDLDLAGRERVAHANFLANLPRSVEAAATEFTLVRIDDLTYRVDASASTETGLARLVGDGGWRVAVTSTAGAAVEPMPVEVVFAFDVTNSMGFNSGQNWILALAALEDTLDALESWHGTDAVATVVPFTDRVNLGTQRPAAWFSATPQSSQGFNGCLEPREEASGGWPHTLTDAPPSALRFRPTQRGQTISNLGPGLYGGNSLPACSSTPVTGPTNDIGALSRQLSAGLARTGSGRFDEAMAWTWRLVSPNWRDQWAGAPTGYPAAYGEARKIVVFVTDGNTNVYRHEVLNGKQASVYGDNQGSKLGFDNFEAVCTAMKTAGVEIFTIFLPGNSHFRAPMQRCASSLDHAFEARTQQQYINALRSVGTRGREESLRLTR